MLGDVAPFKASERAHPNVIELREQEGVDKMAALDGELWVINRFLRDLEPGRPGAQKSPAPSPIEFGLRLASAGNEKGEIELEKVVTLNDIRVTRFDESRQTLDRGVLRFIDCTRIDLDQLFPAGVVGDGDAGQMIASRRFQIAAGKREHLDLHPFQFFERQLFEECPPCMSEVVLHGIAQGKEIATGVFQPIAERDQFLPAVGR